MAGAHGTVRNGEYAASRQIASSADTVGDMTDSEIFRSGSNWYCRLNRFHSAAQSRDAASLVVLYYLFQMSCLRHARDAGI